MSSGDPHKKDVSDEKTLTIPSFLPTGIMVPSVFSGYDSFQRLFKYEYALQQQAIVFQKMMIANPGSHYQISHDAFRFRNSLLEIVRRSITAGGLSMSEYLKHTAPTFEAVRRKYAKGVDINSPSVSQAVVNASTRSNSFVTSAAKRSVFFGMTAVFGIPAYGAWTIYRATEEERVYAAFQMASEVTGGALAVWRGVPAIWGLARLRFPGLAGIYVTVMHVVICQTMGIVGSGIGHEGFRNLRNFWEERSKK